MPVIDADAHVEEARQRACGSASGTCQYRVVGPLDVRRKYRTHLGNLGEEEVGKPQFLRKNRNFLRRCVLICEMDQMG